MKQATIALLLAVIAISCGKPEETSREKMIAQRDSLHTVVQDLNKQIDKINKQIIDENDAVKLTLVTTHQPEQKRFEHFFDVYGSVEADKNVLLYPEASGEILQVKVQEGDYVNKGELLMKLDDKIIRNTIQEVEKSLELAADVYERQKRLWDQNIGSQMQYLQAKNNKESLEEKLETLEAQKTMTRVKAPFSGVVDDLMMKEGQLAGPQMPVMRLVNLSEIYVKAEVSEKYVAVVGKGTPTSVNFESIGIEIDTTVSRTGEFINPGNRTFVARVDIDSYDGQIKPNLLAKLRIKDYESDSAVVIPSNMIQQTPNGDSYVFVLDSNGENNTVEKRILEVGQSYRGETEVLNGLSAQEMIINKGARSIQNGQEVEVTKAD